MDINYPIWKYRLKYERNIIDKRIYNKLDNKILKENYLDDLVSCKIKEIKMEVEYSSCYEADKEGKCYNTYKDIKWVYECKLQFLFDIYKVYQCHDMPSAKEEQGEEYWVVGNVELSFL